MKLFIDANHDRAVANSLSISCIIFTFISMVVHCKFGKQPFVATHSTYYEFRTFYIATMMADHILWIKEFASVDLLKPIRGLGDNRPTLDIIQNNSLTSQVKHITVIILYIYEQLNLHKIRSDNISTQIQPYDIVTKTISFPLLEKLTTSVVYAYTPLRILIVILSLTSIFMMFFGPCTQPIFDHINLPLLQTYYHFIIIVYSFL